MIKNYLILLWLCCCCVLNTVSAQQTISAAAKTDPVYQTSGGGVSFVVQNTNSYPVILTGLDAWWGNNGTNEFTFKLWYSQTSLTGTSNLTTVAANWTEIATSNPIRRIEASGGTGEIRTIFQDELSLSIPANTQYRFYLQCLGSGWIYYTAAAGADSIRTVNGVTLKTGNARINGAYIGYTGTSGALTTAQRHFIGNLRFIDPGCPTQLKGGKVTATPAWPLCSGDSSILKVSDYSASTDIVYQWQSSASLNGTYSNVGDPIKTNPATSVKPTSSAFYRCAVICAGTTVYSDTVEVKVSPGALAAGTYSINAGQATSGSNFKSFYDAVNAIRCGITGPVVFNVTAGSGPYIEQVTIPQIPGASATNTITFNGNNDTVRYENSTTAFAHVLKFDGADYVTINNLNLVTAKNENSPYAVIFSGGANYNTIKNSQVIGDSVITNGSGAGIVFAAGTCSYCDGLSGSYNTIENNRVVGYIYSASLSGSTASENTYAVGNVFKNNLFADFSSYGIIFYTANNKTVISGNSFTRPTRNNTQYPYAIHTQANATNGDVFIEKNRIFGLSNGNKTSSSVLYGFMLQANSPNTTTRIENNLFYDNVGGANVYGIFANTWGTLEVYHNTFVMNDTATLTASSSPTYGIYIVAQNTASPKVSVKNNIVSISRGGNGAKAALYYQGFNPISENNILHVNAPQGIGEQSLAIKDAISYKKLSDWRGLGYDLNSFSEYPQFANPSLGNFQPTLALIDNKAENLGITTDFVGVTRAATPDIGALEFSAQPNVLDASIELLSPVLPAAAGNNVVKVKITNVQTLAITSLKLGYSDGAAAQSQDFSGLNIAPGASQEFTFSTAYNLNGWASVYAYISLVNGTADNYHGNDTTAIAELCTALPGGTYTINKAQATGSGNFQTFNDAISAMNCGILGPVTLNVVANSGPYAEQFSIPDIPGTSATNTITINGNRDTLNPVPNSAIRCVIQLDGAKHVTVKDFVIQTLGQTYGWGIQLTNAADSNVIENNTLLIDTALSTANVYGIVIGGTSGSNTSATMNGANYNVIKNNTIRGGYSGLYVGGSSANFNVIENNKFYDFSTYGIQLTFSANNNLITKNEIHRLTRTLNSSLYIAGMYFANVGGGNLITKNRIHDLNVLGTIEGYAIQFVSSLVTVTNPTTISNNLLYNFNLTNNRYGIYLGTVRGAKVHHNTIAFTNLGSSGTSYGIYQTGVSSGVEVLNNLITLNRTGIGIGLYYATDGNNIKSDYNNVIGDENTGLKYYGNYAGTSYTYLTNWKTANNGTLDANSVSIEPLYADSANGNFKPTNVELDNKGNAVGVADDIENVGRALPPDIGAYEFGTALPVTLVNFTAQAIATDVSLTWQTATETNFSHFIVEKSLNGTDFTSLIRTNSKGSGTYSEKDNNAFSSANTLYYRLKIVDVDGKFTYSGINVVKQTLSNISSVSVYPNPVQGNNVWVKLQSAQQGKVTVKLIDFSGRVITTQSNNVVAGANIILLQNFKQLPSGMYNVVVTLNGENFVSKLVK